MPNDENWALEASGLWVCGECDHVTDTTHFYEDRMTGLMAHEADTEKRKKAADRCGWSFDYDDGIGVRRCVRPDHPWDKDHNVALHGVGRFTSTSLGARPPAQSERGHSPVNETAKKRRLGAE